MEKKQFYDIKYPFTNEDGESYFIDLNRNERDKVKSMLIHLIFTPERQRIRRPEFGTNLVKYIFEPNDGTTKADIVDEIKTKVERWIPNVSIKDIETKTENGTINVMVYYTIVQGNKYLDDIISIDM